MGIFQQYDDKTTTLCMLHLSSQYFNPEGT